MKLDHTYEKVSHRYWCRVAKALHSEAGFPTLRAVRSAARKGCPRCLLLTTAIDALLPQRLPKARVDAADDEFRVQDSVISVPHRRPCRLTWREQAGAQASMSFEIFTTAELEGDFEQLIGLPSKRIPSGDTGSSEALHYLKGWMDLCRENHASCCQARNDVELPTRVLDISRSQVRLRKTNGKRARYAALSHCWGKNSNIIRCTSENYKSLVDGIEWAALPPTFQQAITIARSLDIQCLWIDSLCIIQDDPNDWQTEAAGMGDIYQNAYVTLAATSSPDSHGGLFWQRDSSEEAVQLGVLQLDPETTAPIFARRIWDHKWDNNPSFPLLQRGWVYQERLLSPRFVHFTAQELCWECNGIELCECGGPADQHPVSVKQSFNSDHRLSEGDDGSGGGLTAVRWTQLMHEYSQLQLTRPEDRLPALAGIASKFADKGQLGDYCAGMWSKSLQVDLCWYTRDPEPSTSGSSKLATYTPSWSWIASAGSVSWATNDEQSGAKEATRKPAPRDWELCFQILEIDYESDSVSDMLGMVRFAQIRVVGTLRRATITPFAGAGELPGLKKEEGRLGLTFRNGVQCLCLWDRVASERGKEVSCLITRRGDFFQEYIVMEVVSEQDQTYRRVGMAWDLWGKKAVRTVSYHIEKINKKVDSWLLRINQRTEREAQGKIKVDIEVTAEESRPVKISII